ncbi:MAG: riboflavin biosynthesis protein RibD [Candidatus Melainabacteria bacterium RIFCSPHIGHO2_02_FULL_34_12]|nr:MAG: riboflavin biosynthesis protein RibD [Candidatus Melainabacteria bacterium RIFCSPHIGHO2_02_FULL_34_12]
MSECFELAKKALGKTSPNPAVGAIVLNKDGLVIGKGFHLKAGSEHAEVMAIREAGKNADNGTLIINLEPCCHMGKTLPCTDLIIKSGIKEVVFSNYDPNPLVNKKSEKILRENKINVISGVLESEGNELNKFFFKWIRNKLPWITLKQAQTLDGKIALQNKKSRWISGEVSRGKVHELRNIYDAVMVGANTVNVDNPELTVRELEGGRNPIRIILDKDLVTSPKSKVFEKNSDVFLITKSGHDKKKLNEYLKDAVNIFEFGEDKDGELDLKAIFLELGKRNILSIFIEAGPGLASELIKNKLIDEYVLFISPMIFGNKTSIPTFNLNEIENINEAYQFGLFDYKKTGNDLMLVLRPNFN